MSWHVNGIQCDADGCNAFIGAQLNAIAARSRGREKGWQVDKRVPGLRTQDRCPEHHIAKGATADDIRRAQSVAYAERRAADNAERDELLLLAEQAGVTLRRFQFEDVETGGRIRLSRAQLRQLLQAATQSPELV